MKVHNCKGAPCYVCGSEDGSGEPMNTSNDELELALALAQEMLAELRAIRAALGAGSRSSVELKTAGVKNAVGEKTELTVKAYEGSAITEPLIEAISGFKAGINEIEFQQLTHWAQEVSIQAAKREQAA